MTQVGAQTSAVTNKATPVLTVRPCLTFNEKAEEAINFYVSLFRNSKVLNLLRSDGSGPLPEGTLLHATFQLDGQEYTAFDGGPAFSFTEAFSLVVTCETQDEIDEMWARLSQGGEEGPWRLAQRSVRCVVAGRPRRFGADDGRPGIREPGKSHGSAAQDAQA